MTKENNQNITPIISLASKYLYAKKYRKSLKEFTKAYNIDNSNREAYIGLIGCLIQLNKHKQAREKIEEIIVSDFKKEVREIMEPWFGAVKDDKANYKNKSAAMVFLNLVFRQPSP